MVTDANAPYDPDAPPESSFITEMVGKLVTSVMVDPNNLAAVAPHIADAAGKYWEKGRPAPVWFLEAHGISVVRSDAQPFRQSDIISLTDKNGKWLSKGMTPDLVATAYRNHSVTASWLQVGQANSAVDRIFHFKTTKVGKNKDPKYDKNVTLFPLEIFPVGYVYAGEVVTVEPKQDDAGAPTTAPKTSEADAVKLLQEALLGKKPAEMFDAILGSSALKSVGTLYGVSLMEAATDESLAKVLVENNVLTLVDGVFQAAA